MSISFRCTHCDRKYTVSDSFAGKKANCKDCGVEMRVPSGASAPAPQSRPSNDRFGIEDLPAPKPLYEVDDEPIPPRRAPASWSPRERSSRPRRTRGGEYDPITKLNVSAVALFGAATVVNIAHGFYYVNVPQGQPIEIAPASYVLNFLVGLSVIASLLMMVIAIVIAVVKLVGFGEVPESGILGTLAWVFSVFLVGVVLLAIFLVSPKVYQRALAVRAQQAGQGAAPPQANPPQGLIPPQPNRPQPNFPQMGPPQEDVRVVLSDGQVMRRTMAMGAVVPGVEFQVSYNIEVGRPIGEKFVLMIKSRTGQGQLTTRHLQGSGTISGSSPIASIDDGPFEVWMELESFGGRNSRRVSDSITLRVVDVPAAQPGQNRPGIPNMPGPPPMNRPGMPNMPGPIGPRSGRGPRGFPGGRP